MTNPIFRVPNCLLRGIDKIPKMPCATTIAGVALVALAVLGAAGSVYLLATSGGPSGHPLLFYTGVGTSTTTVAGLSVLTATSIVRNRSQSKQRADVVPETIADVDEGSEVTQEILRLLEERIAAEDLTPESFDALFQEKPSLLLVFTQRILEKDQPDNHILRCIASQHQWVAKSIAEGKLTQEQICKLYHSLNDYASRGLWFNFIQIELNDPKRNKQTIEELIQPIIQYTMGTPPQFIDILTWGLYIKPLLGIYSSMAIQPAIEHAAVSEQDRELLLIKIKEPDYQLPTKDYIEQGLYLQFLSEELSKVNDQQEEFDRIREKAQVVVNTCIKRGIDTDMKPQIWEEYLIPLFRLQSEVKCDKGLAMDKGFTVLEGVDVDGGLNRSEALFQYCRQVQEDIGEREYEPGQEIGTMVVNRTVKKHNGI